jgi:hypothetical protein
LIGPLRDLLSVGRSRSDSGGSTHLGAETYAARATAQVMCDERGERPRRVGRGLLESAGVGRPVGAVRRKRRLRAGHPSPLQLHERGAGSNGEGQGAGVRAARTAKAARVGIERRAARRDARAAAGAAGKLGRETRGVERAELERAEERAGRFRDAEPGEKLLEESEETIRGFGGAGQVVEQLRPVAGVGDAVQVLAQGRMRLDDGGLAQHPQLLARPFVEQDLEALERLERPGKALARGTRAPGEGGHPPASPHEEVHDQVALRVRMRPEHECL